MQLASRPMKKSHNTKNSAHTVASRQIHSDLDCLETNQMSISSKTDNLICSF
jgi:hypothetical protein